ncbi:TetR/AcrR family transcriptional regulator [Flavobacterium sufflavum]|uniref:TetR/AcrR family transcriptional regulator n=1 Tax=Flavobacterium sufflavum TaxID=1921138 RepID=A0A437L2X8_9FLAO|nr:TetR/AcrR family transcriptional regulator [Flavobacterium sufflavum]RVT79655.1 TetR/AcrR family transcriptional regulator [Flavobacterium sufflavum]
MRDKIISKAIDLFLKLGFKSVSMNDIAYEMQISKKTIYKYFDSKELLISESTKSIHNAVHENIKKIISKNCNAIEENFEIIKMFKEMFKMANSSPVYQLKKHYPNIFNALLSIEVYECKKVFEQNIEKGIQQELYRKDFSIEHYVSFYYTLIFSINENTSSEKELNKLELEVLEYHTRAMATEKGIIELKRQIQFSNDCRIS